MELFFRMGDDSDYLQPPHHPNNLPQGIGQVTACEVAFTLPD